MQEPLEKEKKLLLTAVYVNIRFVIRNKRKSGILNKSSLSAKVKNLIRSVEK